MKTGPKPKPIAERFWPKVNVRDERDCWEWTAARNEKGYGAMGGRNTGHRYAHRVSWELANGPIPDGLCVLHRCDNPPCVNPAHLFLGSYADNNRDCLRKDRRFQPDNVGAANGRAKLTETNVRELRERFDWGADARALAAEYGVTREMVYGIGKRRFWRHIA